MVMHARKQPRLNDGYADRKDTHLHQDMQYPSKLYTDGSDDDGPIGGRNSPRYQNKPSYIERNKEKRGGLSLAEKKVSHYLATGSLGRPIPLDTSFSDNVELGGGPFNDQHRSSGHHRKERGRDSRDYNSHHGGGSSSSHKTSADHSGSREYNSHYSGGGEHRPQATATSSSANNGKQASASASKEVSALQVQKSAIRVCGDWSEHISSSGKRYYYNCKTEVSQWEKPKDWVSELEIVPDPKNPWCKTPDHRSKDGRQRALAQTPHANKISAESRASRHSSSSDHQQLQHTEHSRHRANSGDENSGGRDTSSVPNAHQGREQQYKIDRTRLSVDSRDSNNSNLTYPQQHQTHYQSQQHRSGSTPGGGNNGHPEDYHNSRYEHQQYSSSLDYRRQGSDPTRRNKTDGHGSRRQRDPGQGPIDDMDISPSPSPSPSSSQPSSTVGTPQHQQPPPTSTPSSASHFQHPHQHHNSTPQHHHHQQRSSSPQGNPIPTVLNRQTSVPGEGEAYDETIQTLKKLQNALSMHIKAQQSTSAPSRPSMTQPTSVRHPHSSLPSVSHSGGVPISSISGNLQQLTPHHLHHHPQASSAAMSGGNNIPVGISSQAHMYPHHQHTGLLPMPHHPPPHHLYQQHQQMLPGGAGMPVSGSSGPGGGQASVNQQGQSVHEENNAGRTSPVSATSSRSSCGSPTPSDSSSQNAAVTSSSSQALTAAAMKREETAKLTASLSNYYNEKLIGHVLGWQADVLEKQASKWWEEWMVNGSLHASQISVQLKRARSQVRIAEIQSTLHEQRIMSSEQQRQEIENLKTPSNFLPS